MVWHAGFWDSPKSGMLTYRGEECWFEMVAEDQEETDGWYRRFVVLRLSREQHADELRWHELFREKVGLHTDYDEQGKRTTGLLRPRELWKEFYDAHRHRPPRDFSANEILGWLER